jgi:sugar phosphate isomerase/epimerase
MKNNISVSTGGYKNLTGLQATKYLKKNKIFSIELSGGKYSKNQVKQILSFKNKLNLRIHNYFPPPKNPFVINLASDNKKILNQSINHIKKSILLVKKLGGNIYSFHAGFRLDPNFKSLGKKFEKIKMISKKKAINNFIIQTQKISKFAKKNKVNILLENNVVTKKNFNRFKGNPFLLTNYKDVINFFKLMPKNVRLLIDVAHLKVSANTEKLDPIKSLKIMNKYVKGYHFSENNGHIDSNGPFNKKAWFLPYIKKNLEYYSIEVYNKSPTKLKSQINILTKELDTL